MVYECPRLFDPLPKSETKLKKKIGTEEIVIYVTNEDKSEKWQESEKGEELSEKINALDEAYGNIESVEDDLNGVIGSID